MELPIFLFTLDDASSAKQKGNAPQTGQSHKGIDDPAEKRTLTTKEPGHQIELENAHKAPVQGADDGQNQCQRVHFCYLRSVMRWCYLPQLLQKIFMLGQKIRL